jgi:hypothetical protein
LEYGRLLWKNPLLKTRLLHHWEDERHPYSVRFKAVFRPWIEKLLSADKSRDETLDLELEKAGYSLRSIIREIPPVFGGFF